MVTVERRSGESDAQLLKRFRKAVAKSGRLSAVRRKRWYTSKSELRRLKKKKAIRRARRPLFSSLSSCAMEPTEPKTIAATTADISEIRLNLFIKPSSLSNLEFEKRERCIFNKRVPSVSKIISSKRHANPRKPLVADLRYLGAHFFHKEPKPRSTRYIWHHRKN